MLAEPDQAKRAAYEDRAAHSEPGLEPEAVKAEQAQEAEKGSPVTR